MLFQENEIRPQFIHVCVIQGISGRTIHVLFVEQENSATWKMLQHALTVFRH